MTKTIVVDVSSVGYGHLAQIGPVIDELSRTCPFTSIVLRTRHSESVVRQFVTCEVAIGEPPQEVGVITRGPNAICVEQTLRAYRSLHAEWDRIVDVEAERLSKLDPCLLISNISYLSLAAAARLSLTSMALCSLNWLEMLRSCIASDAEMPDVIEAMTNAYRSAAVFLQPCPHIPMRYLPNRRSIGPIARTGHDRSDELRQLLGISAEKSIALVTTGGVPATEMVSPGADPRIHWIVQGQSVEQRSDITYTGDLHLAFVDLIASVDVIVCKDSYGTVTEAVCHGKRLVIAPRLGSYEAASILEWACVMGTVVIAADALSDPGSLLAAVVDVRSRSARPRPAPTGAAEVARHVSSTLGLGTDAARPSDVSARRS